MPQGRVKIYSQVEITEMQKAFVEELNEIHNIVSRILNKHTSKKDVKSDLVGLLVNIYDRQIIIQKDIIIEASNNQIENASN